MGGRKIVEKGDHSYIDIKIDPEEFKVLIFTSGTTSGAKGVMICNRNLAQNINAVNPYVKLLPEDRMFSVHRCVNNRFYICEVYYGSVIRHFE